MFKAEFVLGVSLIVALSLPKNLGTGAIGAKIWTVQSLNNLRNFLAMLISTSRSSQTKNPLQRKHKPGSTSSLIG